MSGKLRRIKLDDGRQIDVPEENAQALMEDLDKAGLAFSSDGEPPPSAAESDPPSLSAPGVSEAPLGPPRREGEGFSAPEGGSAWGRFADAALAGAELMAPGLKYGIAAAKDPVGAIKTGYDAVGGALHGASSGLGDDALDALPGAMGDEARAQWAQSQQRSPTAFAIGDTAGSFLSPINKVGRALGLVDDVPKAASVAQKALGFGKNVLGQGVEGGIQGAARTVGDADEGANTGETALRALAQGGEDFLQGGVGAALLSGAGRVSDAAVSSLHKRANMNRAASAGFYGSTLERLGDNKGDDYVADMGRRMEEEGLHKGRAVGGGLNPMNWLPQNAGTIAENAADLKGRARTDMMLPEAEIARMDAPPQVDVRGMIAKQGAPVRGSDIDPVAGDAENRFRGQMADRAAQLAPEGQMPFNDALDRRRYLDDQVNWQKKEGYEGAGMQEQVRREMANDLRGGISESLQGAAANGSVDPELAQQWERGRGNFELASDVGDAARSRSMREQGNQIMSLPTHALVGGALGGALGGGLPGAAAAAIGGQMLKTRGRAGLAGMQRGMANVGQVGGIGRWAGENAALGSMAALDSGGVPDNGDDALRSMGEQLSQSQQEGRGYLLPQAVKQALQTGELGTYEEEFAGLSDEGDIQRELDRLERTDPEFKRQVMPRLIQMTAER